MEDDRRRDMLAAIARARVALRGVEAELRSAGGTKAEVGRVNAALDKLTALENAWAW